MSFDALTSSAAASASKLSRRRAGDHLSIEQLDGDRTRSLKLERPPLRISTRHRRHLVSGSDEKGNETPAHNSGSTGNEYLHRSYSHPAADSATLFNGYRVTRLGECMQVRTLTNLLIGLAVFGLVVTGGLVVRKNRASPEAVAVPAAPDARTPTAPAPATPPSSAAAPTAPKALETWQKYIPTGRLIGPENARIKIVEFADFQCPACRTFHYQLKELRSEYPGALAISYHYVPLPYHQLAYPAARAAECAAAQGRFEAYHDILFDKLESLAKENLTDLARQAGVPNLPKFSECAARTETVERIDNDWAIAMGALAIKGTPTVLMNGQMYLYSPAIIPELKRMIEESRSRAGKP
jgi:protein-disulfide isomerase